MSADHVSDAVLVQEVVECLFVEDAGCVPLDVVGEPVILRQLLNDALCNVIRPVGGVKVYLWVMSKCIFSTR